MNTAAYTIKPATAAGTDFGYGRRQRVTGFLVVVPEGRAGAGKACRAFTARSAKPADVEVARVAAQKWAEYLTEKGL